MFCFGKRKDGRLDNRNFFSGDRYVGRVKKKKEKERERERERDLVDQYIDTTQKQIEEQKPDEKRSAHVLQGLSITDSGLWKKRKTNKQTNNNKKKRTEKRTARSIPHQSLLILKRSIMYGLTWKKRREDRWSQDR